MIKLWLLVILATAAAGRPTEVSCTNYAPRRITISNWAGWAYIGLPKIYLRPSICKDASIGKKYALEIIGHEAAHTRGYYSEDKADEFAKNKLRLLLDTYNDNK